MGGSRQTKRSCGFCQHEDREELEKQFAEACEDISDRVLNMADNLHYKTMLKVIPNFRRKQDDR